jgi:hypothetical protein
MTDLDLTRTCQDGAGFTIASVIQALEDAWTDIRSRHTDVPHAVLVVASGSTARSQLVLGHFAGGRWQHGDARLPEVLVSGEGLRRPVPEVLTTLLHEATHGLAHTRGIKDTSRQGRWHNKHFAVLAIELGLIPHKDPTLGWSPCTLPPVTADIYADTLDRLTAALSVFRHPEPAGLGSGRTSSNNAVACECDCARRIRVAATVYDAGPITCGVCGANFRPTEPGGAP